MTKRLVIVAAMMTFCGGAMAQDEGTSSGGGFFSGMSLNTNNKYQISLLLGNQTMFDQSLTYLTPQYSNDPNKAIGLPSRDNQSTNPITYIRFNDLGQGDLVNMAGVQFTYFLTDGIDINASFGMDLRSTPKKDFLESEQIKDMTIQGQKWIEGQFQNNWLLTLGGNYHFTVSNEKLDMYAGLQFGYQHGHINTYTPYTDADYAYLVTNAKEAEEKANAAQALYDQCKSLALNQETVVFDKQMTWYTAKSEYLSAQYDAEIAQSMYDRYYKTASNDAGEALTKLNDAKSTTESAKALWEADKNNKELTAAYNKAQKAQEAAQSVYDDANKYATKLADDKKTTSIAATKAETEMNTAESALKNAQTVYSELESKLESAKVEATEAAKVANAALAGQEEVLYKPRVGSGQVVCFTTAITAGVNYALSDGLFLGLEFSPYTFTYTSLSVCPQANQSYKAVAYANRFFANTLLKIGFRF